VFRSTRDLRFGDGSEKGFYPPEWGRGSFEGPKAYPSLSRIMEKSGGLSMGMRMLPGAGACVCSECVKRQWRTRGYLECRVSRKGAWLARQACRRSLVWGKGAIAAKFTKYRSIHRREFPLFARYALIVWPVVVCSVRSGAALLA